MKVLVCGALVCAAACLGADAGISGPVVGYIFDAAAGQFRAINGIPGSAVVGAPIDVGVVLRSGLAGAKGTVAAGMDGAQDDRLWVLRNLNGNPPPASAVDGVIAGVPVALSVDQSTVLLVSDKLHQAQFVNSLAAQPEAGQPLALDSGAFAAAVVESTGRFAVAAVAGATDTGLYLLWNPRSGRSDVVPVGRVPSVSGVALSNGGRDAVVADRSSNRVYVLQDVAGAATLVPALDGSRGIGSPVAVGTTSDGAKLLVATADSSVAVVDLASLTVMQTVATPFAPTRCTSLGDDVYLLDDRGTGPLTLLDAANGNYRSVFVPR